MSKVLFILMQNYRDEEFTVPYEMILDAKHEVDVAGITPEPAIGVKGHRHEPNLVLSELSTQEFDKYAALVIPGGPGSTTYLWDNEELFEIIRYFHGNQKVVAAICHAVVAIAKSGILLNKHATVYPTDEAKAILEEYGARLSKDGCVALKPEKIITAQGPQFARDFGQEILNLLK